MIWASVPARALSLLALLISAWPTVAAAQGAPLPVDVVVEGTFGPDALLEGGYASVLVTLTNRSSTAFSGTVAIGTADWNVTPERHEIDVDLPAGEVRRVIVTVFVPSSGTTVDVEYRDAGGSILGVGGQSVAYAPATRSIVVIAEQPAHLRAALLDLQYEETSVSPSTYPSPSTVRTVAIPVGGAQLDGRTGDPLLPREPQAYATVRIVIASLPTLARVGEVERRAIEDWVAAGGTLVLSPRSPADYALPLVAEHFGEVTQRTDAWAAPSLTPRETIAIACTAADSVDGVGCARTLGQGLVRLIPFDLTGASVDGVWARPLVLALVHEQDARATPALPFGRGIDPTDGGWFDGTPTFAYLRRALDPNEGYRTSLVLVAIILFLYVIVVGPVHFKLIERRGQPTLALITTPLLSLACALALFGVGWIGKGIVMRYRRLAFVEVRAGASRGTTRSYTGYFFTRPSSTTISPDEGDLARRVAAPGGVTGPTYHHRDRSLVLEGVRGGLWDTVFVREDGMIDLGGAVNVEVDGSRVVALANDSAFDLRSAFYVDTTGAAYVIGDVPAHGRAPVADVTGWYLYRSASWWGEGGDQTTTTLSALLRLSSDEEPLARGLQSVLGSAIVDMHAGAVYAWIEPEDASSETDFARDWDRRLVRIDVVGRLPILADSVPRLVSEPSAFDLPPSGGPQ